MKKLFLILIRWFSKNIYCEQDALKNLYTTYIWDNSIGFDLA